MTSFENNNLHRANIPPHLLAPLPRTSYLWAGTISASETPSPRKQQHIFNESNLNNGGASPLSHSVSDKVSASPTSPKT
jgi:hypothetical protein